MVSLRKLKISKCINRKESVLSLRRRHPQAAWRPDRLSPRVLSRQVLRLRERFGLDPGECAPHPLPAPPRPSLAFPEWLVLDRGPQAPRGAAGHSPAVAVGTQVFPSSGREAS